MASKRAGEIMIPLGEYPHIPTRYTLREAIEEMEAAVIDRDGRISLPRALLVFERDYRLVGILRRRDIMKGLEPPFLRDLPIQHQKKLFDIQADINLVDLQQGHVAEAMSERAGLIVEDWMQPIDASVKVHDHLARCIYRMIEYDMSLLPVTDGPDVVGVIRSVDVFHEISHLIL